MSDISSHQLVGHHFSNDSCGKPKDGEKLVAGYKLVDGSCVNLLPTFQTVPEIVMGIYGCTMVHLQNLPIPRFLGTEEQATPLSEVYGEGYQAAKWCSPQV